MPYKDQNLDYLYSIQKDFSAYKGAVVAFNGEVAGVRETAQNMRIILRIDTPLYYYATGKGNTLAYEMIYVRFTKDTATHTAIRHGHKLKVLGRVDGYEKRQDTYTGKTLGVVRLDAIALADRTTGKDFIRQDAPSNALYQSWKAGKLFFEESAESVLRAFPPAPTPEPKPKAIKPVKKTPKKETPKPAVIPPAAGIVFDEEEPPFILPPDPQVQEEPQAPNATEQSAPKPESQPGNAALMNNPAEEKETEEKTTPSKTAIEQTAEQAVPSKATGEQAVEQAAPNKTVNPALQSSAVQEKAPQAPAVPETDLQAPATPKTGAQKSATPQAAAPETDLQGSAEQKAVLQPVSAGTRPIQTIEPPAAPEKTTLAEENTRPQQTETKQAGTPEKGTL